MNILKLSWAEFKDLVNNEDYQVIMNESDSVYSLTLFNTSVIFRCDILKNTPAGVDQLDFENNYKASVNKRIYNKVIIGNGSADMPLLNSDPGSSSFGAVVRNIPKTRATYSASAEGIVPAASATDIFTINGSATKTIYIHKITVSGTRTAHAHDRVILLKRSTANSGGTSVVRSIVPHDSVNDLATAVVRSYTANPTLGTLVGNIYAATVSFPAQTPSNAQGNGGASVPWQWNYVDIGQPIILRGTAQQVSINLNSVTIAGGLLHFAIEWSEE